jgi:ElaB/YqjD/DUF883 family membrane-anchored ribosome-binding protein
MSNRSHEPDQLLDSLLSRREPMQGSGDERGRPESDNDDLDGLIDELEAMFEQAKRVPFGRRLMVDEAYALELVDRLRSSLPSEVRQARYVLDEQQRIMDEAREQARQLLDEQGLMAELEVMRERTIASAEQEAERIRADADAYVHGVLNDLSERLAKIQASVRNGIEALQSSDG